MDPEEAGKSKVGMSIGAVILVALGLYLVWSYSKNGGGQKTAPTLGEKVSGEVAPTPAESVPDVNPYKTETNPFEKANPLKNIYKNPFGQ